MSVSGFAPFYLFPVPLIMLMLLATIWRNCSNAKQAALAGFCFGLGMFGAGVTWIYVSLHDFGGMPMPMAVFALIALCAYLSLFPAFTGWVSSARVFRAAWIWPWMVAALWVLSEWLRGTLFTGFPWLAVGYSQSPYGPLSGFAAVIGVYGISLLLVLSAGWLACWVENKQAWRFWVALGAVWGIGFGLQHVNWVKPAGEPVTFSLLQGNIPQDLKWQPGHLASTIQTYVQLVKASPSRLIVTPEISFPLFREQAPPEYLSILAEHARMNQGDVLIGMAEQDASKNGSYYNSMFSFGSSPEQSYRKHHLVPFGEFIPLKPVFGWVVDVLDFPMSDFSRGGLEQRPLDLAGQRVAINICYEDVFGEEIVLQLPEATLLVNVSNDAWFGRSIGPWQHLQISQMRAQETGRYMLRATNTGVTAMIDERGRVLDKMDMFTTGGLHGLAQGFSGATPYVRYGNTLVIGFICLILLIGSALAFSASRKIL